jgi:hypothetical protein
MEGNPKFWKKKILKYGTVSFGHEKNQEIGNIGRKLRSDTPRYMKIHTGKPIAYWQSDISANKSHLSK